jgi:hypothetical protein
MTGHLTRNINSILWADSEIIEIFIDYDVVRILIRESTGNERVVTCEGYIGYKTVGFWDDMIVRSGTVEHNHQFIIDCLDAIQAKYKDSPPLTGNAIRNKKLWCLLKVELIDSTEIMIVCGNVKVSNIG